MNSVVKDVAQLPPGMARLQGMTRLLPDVNSWLLLIEYSAEHLLNKLIDTGN